MVAVAAWCPCCCLDTASCPHALCASQALTLANRGRDPSLSLLLRGLALLTLAFVVICAATTVTSKTATSETLRDVHWIVQEGSRSIAQDVSCRLACCRCDTVADTVLPYVPNAPPPCPPPLCRASFSAFVRWICNIDRRTSVPSPLLKPWLHWLSKSMTLSLSMAS
jgi:hypothetical protein